MKSRIIAAVLIAVFLLLAPSHAMAGNGEDKTGNSPDGTDSTDSTFNWQDFMPPPSEEPQPPPTVESEPPPVEEPPSNPWITDPITPPGTGTVIDNSTDADGKEFFTVRTANGNIFYLIVDRRNHQENVYFLNAVTERDLLALAELAGDVEFPAFPMPELPPIIPPELETEEPDPIPEPEPEQGGLNMGLVIVLAVVGGVGAGWYFKIYRPKKQQSVRGDDFDYGDEDDSYTEDTEDHAPPWDTEDEE